MKEDDKNEDIISIQEFEINKFLTVKLEKEKTFSDHYFKHVNIYVNKEKITIFNVFFNRPHEFPKLFDKIQSIDDMEDYYDHFGGTYQVSQEEIFWVVCSNLQTWAENDYNPNLLYYKIFFRLVKKLSELGDLKAKEIFQNELIKKIETGYKPYIDFLAREGYFYYLSVSYIQKIFKLLGFKQVNEFDKSNFKFNKNSLLKDLRNEIVALYIQKTWFYLGRLPFSFEGLSSLKKIYINSNLTYLPDSIDKLQHLTELEITPSRDHSLTVLTDSICMLRSLEVLKILRAEIESLPQDIGNLKKLREFEISGLKSNFLPESFIKLKSLEILKIRASNINSLPNEIGALSKLRVLNLSFNNLKSIPESVSELKNLEILNLSSNNIETLPKSISSLQSLKKLYLGNNKLKELPKTLANLKSLKVIFLSGNLISDIPNEFKNKGITIIALKNPLKLGMTKEFNNHNKFLSLLLQDSPHVVSYSINENLFREILELFEDEEFFEYLKRNIELSQNIFIPILEEIFTSINGKLLYDMFIKSLSPPHYYILTNLLEIFLTNMNEGELKEFRHKIPEQIFEIFYRVFFVGDSDFWYEEGREKVLIILPSEFIKNKIINSIDQEDLNEIVEIIDNYLWDLLSEEDTLSIFIRKNNIITFLVSNASEITDFRMNIYHNTQFYFPKNLHPECKNLIKNILKDYLENGRDEDIKFIILTGIYGILDKDFYANLDKFVLTRFLDIFIETGIKQCEDYDDFINRFENLANQFKENFISNYLKDKIVKALNINNYNLIQKLFMVNSIRFLIEQDINDLLSKTNLVSFIINEMQYLEDPYFSFRDFQDILKNSRIIANKFSQILSEIIKKENVDEIESMIKLDLLDFIEEDHIKLLLKKSRTFFTVLFENDYYDNDYLYDKIETIRRKYESLAKRAKIDRIIKILKEKRIEDVFKNLWHKWWLDSLTIEEFVELLENPELNLLEQLLRSVHYEGFEKDYDHTCAEFPLLPERFLKEAREFLKKKILRIIKTKKMDTFVPILGNGLLDLLNINEIIKLIQDPEYNFIENLRYALENHNDELYYFMESFDRWIIKFLRALMNFDIDVNLNDVNFSLSLPTLIFGVEPYKKKWIFRDNKILTNHMESLDYVEVAGKKILVKRNKLDLSNSYIQNVNEIKGLFQLASLKELDLSGNNLNNIPEQIGNLISLEKLNLAYCGLVNLPKAIGNLKNLKELGLSANKLNSLPNTIKLLSKLEVLDLSYTKLTSIPESFRELKSLRELNFHSVPILELPYWFGELQQLESLDFVFTQLTELPETFGNLKTLKFLSLSWSRLRSLPSSIGNLKSLEYLDISCTKVGSIPDSIINCEALKCVHFLDHHFKELPEVIKKLRIRGVKIGKKY